MSELTRIDRLLTDVETDVRKVFLDYIRRIQSPDSLQRIAAFLEEGRIDLVTDYLSNAFASFEQNVAAAVAKSATSEISALESVLIAALLANNAFSTITTLTFIPTSNDAVRAVQDMARSLRFNIVDGERNLFPTLFSDSMGMSSQERARFFTRHVGMTLRQYQALRNYERQLRENSRRTLDRALRDPKFDEAIQSGRPLTQAQIDRMVESYRRNLLAARSETIARTEAGRMVNEGRRIGLLQALMQAQLDPANVAKTWRSMRDNRVRPTHKHGSGLDGQTVIGMDTPFVSPSGATLRYPHDPQAPFSETANCRCFVIYSLV
jgi:hypothetical protein